MNAKTKRKTFEEKAVIRECVNGGKYYVKKTKQMHKLEVSDDGKVSSVPILGELSEAKRIINVKEGWQGMDYFCTFVSAAGHVSVLTQSLGGGPVQIKRMQIPGDNVEMDVRRAVCCEKFVVLCLASGVVVILRYHAKDNVFALVSKVYASVNYNFVVYKYDYLVIYNNDLFVVLRRNQSKFTKVYERTMQYLITGMDFVKKKDKVNLFCAMFEKKLINTFNL